MITLVLPLPVSANRYWAHRVVKSKTTGKWMALTYVTTEAKAYKLQVGLMARAAGIKMLLGPVSVRITLHPRTTKDGKASRSRLDLDNIIKITIDALNGIAWRDDSQIVWILAEVGGAMDGGGVTVGLER